MRSQDGYRSAGKRKGAPPMLRLGRFEPKACGRFLKRPLNPNRCLVKVDIADPDRKQLAPAHSARQCERADCVERMPVELAQNQSNLLRVQDLYLFLIDLWRPDRASHVPR